MTTPIQKDFSTSSPSPIAKITINRPEALNALNAETLVQLNAAVEEVSSNTNIRCLIITGAGQKAFVAGADVASMAKMSESEIQRFGELGFETMRSIEQCRVPVIAAVTGFALGGGMELALSCDLIVASKQAKFGQPEVNLGIIPGFGGSQRLIYRAGVSVSRRLCYTGEIIDAAKAHEASIVDYLFDTETFEQKLQELCQTIASKAPLAVEAAKRAINECIEKELVSGLNNELKLFLETFKTKDRAVGMQAFVEKRKVEFTRE